MSVAERIEELNDGLLAAYASVETKGGTVPSEKNLDNLPTAIESISGGGAEGDPYITFSTDSGTNSLTTSSRLAGLKLEYSYDTTTWTTWDLTTPLEFGGATKLYLRGTNITLATESANYTTFSFSSNTPLVDCTGKITRLLSYQGEFDTVCFSNYCFSHLFSNCKALRTAPELPCKYLPQSCCSYMFYGCSSLTTVPELPATTLKSYCCEYMFCGCTSLTTAPELPATTLEYGCYRSMFRGCTSLTTAPEELPATTLVGNCYYEMFASCPSLTTVPELPATTLASDCYRNMFYECTSLTTAPELPATTLASECYYAMFYGCTHLTTAPELPATTLEYSCYQYMFYGCRQLSFIKCLATDISASSALYRWTYQVPSTGTFVKAAGVTWPSGTDGIPNGWTVEEV